MAESMNISHGQNGNLIDFFSMGFTQEVNISIKGKSYTCNTCEFKNVDKGGMKRHIAAHTRQKPGGVKRKGVDENHDVTEGKKSKTEEFNPNTTSSLNIV